MAKAKKAVPNITQHVARVYAEQGLRGLQAVSENLAEEVRVMTIYAEAQNLDMGLVEVCMGIGSEAEVAGWEPRVRELARELGLGQAEMLQALTSKIMSIAEQRCPQHFQETL